MTDRLQRSAGPSPVAHRSPSRALAAPAPSLRRRAAWLLIAFATVPVLMLSGIVALLMARTIDARYEMVLQAGAAALVDDLEAALDAYRHVIELIAAQPDPASPRLLDSLLAIYPDVRSVQVIDAAGRARMVRTRPGESPPAAVGIAGDGAAAAASPRTQVSGLIRTGADAPDGGPALIAVRTPVPAADATAGGQVQALLAFDATASRIAATLPAPRQALVADANGRVVLGSAALGLATGTAARGDPFLLAAERADPGQTFAVRDSQGRAWLGAARTNADGWRVANFLPRSFVLAQVRDSVLAAIVVAVLSLLLAALVLRIAVKRLWQPVAELTRAIRDSDRRGEIDPAVRVSLGRELVPIADAFDEALARERAAVVESSRSLARQREAQLRLDAALQQREFEVERRTAALRQAVEAFKARSLSDELTGLANYRAYRECLEDLWATSRANHVPLAVVAMDIDWFKAYNDHYGHPLGDDCLRRVAGLVREALGAAARLIARTGGEEISALFLGEHDGDILRRLGHLAAQLHQAAIEHAASPLGRVTLSIGMASAVAEAGAGPDALVERADRALYQAKRSGRNRITSG